MTTDDLAQFRTSVTGCEIAMLVDLSTHTILGAEGAVKLGQETLDDICAIATRLLPNHHREAECARISQPVGTRIFLRTPNEGEEALCCSFSPDSSVSSAEHAMRTFIREYFSVPRE